MKPMLFQQLYEPESSTYTYLLADQDCGDAVIVDAVLEMFDRDLNLIRELGLDLKHILETHVHADHITAAGKLADSTGAPICISAAAKAEGADRRLHHGEILSFGRFNISVLAVPGHTPCGICYHIEGRVLTGDTLLIRGNGRTDFQNGSAEDLYKNVHHQLFTLPDDTLVYPGHDYKGFTSSTIGTEKRLNARLGGGRPLNEFIHIMNSLKLAEPNKMNVAVPANLKCGR